MSINWSFQQVAHPVKSKYQNENKWDESDTMILWIFIIQTAVYNN